MKNLITLLFVFLSAGISLTSGQTIPDKKSQTVVSDPGIENIMLAWQLTKYGYAHNDPLSLLTAAKIYAQWTPLQFVPVTSETKSGVIASQVQDPFNIDRLLADAVKFSGDNAEIEQLAEELSNTSSKGAKKGPVVGVYELDGQNYLTFEVKFEGNKIAIVAATGDGNADIDLFIMDKDKNIVVKDDAEDYKCLTMWYPEKTAKYYIVVANRGTNATKFAVATN